MRINRVRSIGALAIVLLFLFSAFASPIGSQSSNQTVIHSDTGLQVNQNSNSIGESYGNDTFSISDQAHNKSQSPQPLDGGNHWWNVNWACRKLITIDHTKVGAPLVNFPVLISRSSDSDLAASAQTNGQDIAFILYSDNTTKLNHEIELYNHINGNLVAWVNVPSLSSTGDTKIWMYYGNAGAFDQENVYGTWNNNYRAVYHMNDLTTSTIKDSTSNKFNGTKHAEDNPLENTSGIVGNCQLFHDNSQAFGINLSAAVIPANLFTVEAWFINPGISNNQYHCMVGQYHSSLTGRFYFALTNQTGGNAQAIVKCGSSSELDGLNHADNQWHYGVVTESSNSYKIYIDDVNTQTATMTNDVYQGPTTLGMMSSYDGDTFVGRLDEIRISTVAHDSSWISTTYNSIKSPSTFYSISEEDHINRAPVQGTIYPVNTSSITVVTPRLSIYISDRDEDHMNITWLSNSSGSWLQFGKNSSVLNGTYYWNNSNFSSLHTRYWWKIVLNDGEGGWSNATYNFIITTPIIYRTTPFSNDSDYNISFNAEANDNCTVSLNGWSESFVTSWDGTPAAYFNESNTGTDDLRIFPKTSGGANITNAKGVYLEYQDLYNFMNSQAEFFSITMASNSGNFNFFFYPSDEGVGCIELDPGAGVKTRYYDLGLNRTYANLTYHRVFVHFNNAVGKITFGYDDHIYNLTVPIRTFTTTSVYIDIFKNGHPGVEIDNIKVFKDQVFPLNDYMMEYYSDFKVAYPPNNYDVAYSPVIHADKMTYNQTKVIFPFFNNHGISVSQTYYYYHATDGTEGIGENATLRNYAINTSGINGIYTHGMSLGDFTTAQVTAQLTSWKSLVGFYPKIWVDEGSNRQNFDRDGSDVSSSYYIGGLRNDSSIKYGWVFYGDPLRRIPLPTGYEYNWKNSLKSFHVGNNGLTYSTAGQSNLFSSGSEVFVIDFMHPEENLNQQWDYYMWWLANERALMLEHTYNWKYLYKNIDGVKYTGLSPLPYGYSAWNPAWGPHYKDATNPWMILPEYETAMTNLTRVFCVYSTFGDKLIDRGVIYNGSSVTKAGNIVTLMTSSNLENATIYARTNESGKALSWGGNYSVFTKGFYGYSWGATIPSNDGSHTYMLGDWHYYVGDTGQIGRLVFKADGNVDVHFKRSGSLTVQIPSGIRPSVINNITGGGTVSFSFSNGNVTFIGEQGCQYLVNLTYVLTVDIIGSGSVTIDPTGGIYLYGAMVTLTASPATDWSFDHWGGDLSGDTNPITITMNGNKTVTATFSILRNYNIPVHRYWNLITLPFNESTALIDIRVLKDGIEYSWDEAVSNGIILTDLYSYNGGGYDISTALQPGRGYWLWAYYNCSLTISSYALDTRNLVSLQVGWNMMGLPCNIPLGKTTLLVHYNNVDYTWAQATTNANPTGGPIILGFIYDWNCTNQLYLLNDTFYPDYGYWMYAYQNCLLKKGA